MNMTHTPMPESWVIVYERTDHGRTDPVRFVYKYDGSETAEVLHSEAAALAALAKLAANISEAHRESLTFTPDKMSFTVVYKGSYAGITRRYWATRLFPVSEIAAAPGLPRLAQFLVENKVSCPFKNNDPFKSDEDAERLCGGWKSSLCAACLVQNAHMLPIRDND